MTTPRSLLLVLVVTACQPKEWSFDLAHASEAQALSPALLGQYEISGRAFRFDQNAQLPALMREVGFSEWRVGLGRWEFASRLLPTLTDGTACTFPLPEMAAPAGTTDLDLITERDWFTFTDGGTVTPEMTADDSRYRLDYARSVVDLATSFGAEPFFDLDHMPRALSSNQTPVRTEKEWPGACNASWTNKVSNVQPADLDVFAQAAVGVVKRLVEGSGSEPGRPVRYIEFWNEPESAYAWNPQYGTIQSFLLTAVTTLKALDTYRKTTANPNGRALKLGLGSFVSAGTAAIVLKELDVPMDFISFHSYVDDPLKVAADIETVAEARRASTLHPDVELVLAEWGPTLDTSKLDPKSMDLALHNATVLMHGAAAGLTHAHHSLFWDALPADTTLAFINNDNTPKPAYWAFQLLSKVIGTGATRLELGDPDVLASRDAAGKVRALVVNRDNQPRTISIGATPSAVTVHNDPTRAPHTVTPSGIVDVPARSLVLLEL